MSKGKLVQPARSLLDYKRDTTLEKSKARCAVCALPVEIRKQIAEARLKDTNTRLIIDWLRDDLQKNLAVSDFVTHSNGRHEV